VNEISQPLPPRALLIDMPIKTAAQVGLATSERRRHARGTKRPGADQLEWVQLGVEVAAQC
jgi:hypothetical protein